MILGIIKTIFASPPPVEKPEDLKRFEEARERLHAATKNVIVEADAFGKMLEDMTKTARRSRRKK